MIERIAVNDGNRTLIIADDCRYSYAEAKKMIDNAADRLLTLGKKGDRMIIKADRPVKQLLYFLSSWKAGFASVIVSPNIKKERYDALVQKIDPKVIIHDDVHRSTVKESSREERYSSFFLGALSSGTTGEEKLIWRSYDSWQKAFKYQSRIFNIKSGDRLLLNGDFYYTANLNSALHIIAEGGTIVHTKKKRAAEVMSIIARQKVNAVFMVPALYRVLTAHNDDKALDVRSVVSAGSKLDINTLKALRNIFPKAEIVEYYGAGELGHISYISYEDALMKEGSVGRAFPEVRIHIEDMKIWVESPYIADEYVPRYSAGDMGYLDEDGYLYLMGREGNIINKAGEKIIAEEIERVLVKHPQINEAVVIGRTHKIKGEEIVAFIAGDTGTDHRDLKAEIKKLCKHHLENTKMPKIIITLDKIPRNENGKINRTLLKNYLQDQGL